MTFLLDLRKAIKLNQPIAPLLDSCIRPPKPRQNPLVTIARTWFGDEKLRELIVEAVKDNLFTGIRENQEALQLLNSPQGRDYLHKNLDSLLDYLTSSKFSVQYKCPACSAIFSGKRPNCPQCEIALKWKN